MLRQRVTDQGKMIAEYLVTAADVWACAIALMVRVPLSTHSLAVGVATWGI